MNDTEETKPEEKPLPVPLDEELPDERFVVKEDERWAV
jgi:hypothetical protein